MYCPDRLYKYRLYKWDRGKLGTETEFYSIKSNDNFTLIFQDLVVATVVPCPLTPSWKVNMLHWSEASTSTEKTVMS